MRSVLPRLTPARYVFEMASSNTILICRAGARAARGLCFFVTLLLAACANLTGAPEPSYSASPAIAYALSLRGVLYRYGGSSPGEGFDCSGFVQHVYGRHGIHLPRNTRHMAHVLSAVSVEERRPGDLLFFNTNGQHFSHVGIYLGKDQFIHASSHRAGRVMISSLQHHYWQRHFTGIRRPIR